MSQDFVFFKLPWHVDPGRPCNCDLDEAATLARGWPLPIWALVGGLTACPTVSFVSFTKKPI